MKIYNYRPDTFEFTHSGDLELDPLENKPLIPAFSTDKDPLPKKDGFTVNFINDEWVYKEIPKPKPEQPNEYSVWDEVLWSWVEDEALKEKYLLKLYDGKLQEMMNAAAQAKGYDSIQYAALRAALPNSPFHAEGVAYGEWMDSCNAKGYAVLAQVKSGDIKLPTVEEFLAMMPELVLP